MMNKKPTSKKLTTGGYFDSFDMMKISNVGNLLSQNSSSILTNDLYADARPVFSGISTTADNNTVGLLGSVDKPSIFLPSYNGGGARPKTAAPKAKAPTVKAKAPPKAKAAKAPPKAKAPAKAKK